MMVNTIVKEADDEAQETADEEADCIFKAAVVPDI